MPGIGLQSFSRASESIGLPTIGAFSYKRRARLTHAASSAIRAISTSEPRGIFIAAACRGRHHSGGRQRTPLIAVGRRFRRVARQDSSTPTTRSSRDRRSSSPRRRSRSRGGGDCEASGDRLCASCRVGSLTLRTNHSTINKGLVVVVRSLAPRYELLRDCGDRRRP